MIYHFQFMYDSKHANTEQNAECEIIKLIEKLYHQKKVLNLVLNDIQNQKDQITMGRTYDKKTEQSQYHDSVLEKTTEQLV